MPARISKIELQGFRSFGQARQTINLPDSVAVFWGGNSQGKTSLVEALEFLLTGQIVRREMLASSKDEFAEALRNVHIAPTHPVWVAATVVCADRQQRTLTRRLVDDYRRGSAAGCVSKLEIDGTTCAESDIEHILGLKLSHPPLRAPVLSQHTLGYLFSISPTDRATYFRAILDTQDLEDFRIGVAALQPVLKAPAMPELADLAAIETVPALSAVAPRLRKAKKEADLVGAILACSSALLSSIAIVPAAQLSSQADQIDAELQRRRAQTFPVNFFGRAGLGPPVEKPPSFTATASLFFEERTKMDVEAKRLIDLFSAALLLPDHPDHAQPIDCPLCGTVGTLTADRMAFIRKQVSATATYTNAANTLKTALRNLDGQLDALAQGADRAMPRFMREVSASRRNAGFTVQRIAKLVPDASVVRAWLGVVRPLWRAMVALKRQIVVARKELMVAESSPEHWRDSNALDTQLFGVATAYARAQACLSAYESPTKALGETLKAVVDQSVDINGWEGLVRFCVNPTELWVALMATVSHAANLKSLEKALGEIDTASGKVIDGKFLDLSAGVRSWWDRLRPNETAFFEGIQRRSAKTRRTIDLKVGLSAKDDRSDSKIRDAIAVLSQSQTHCLGLALFLARAVQEGSGLVILDDPVLTSDDDYRPNFVSSVIEGLLDAGLQVIICTQDHKSWKDIGDRWGYRGAVQFQIIRSDAILGTEVRSQNDDLATMIAKAQPLIKSQDPVVRKDGAIRLREAIERFAKMILVRERQRTGNSLASITDYDGTNFATYAQQAMGLLTKDPSHPGKLRAAHSYVTPGPHDDKPPSSGELISANGDLKKLKKDYLD